MKLWLLLPNEELPRDFRKNPWDPWYDKCFGAVVEAETESEARKMVQDHGGDETREINPSTGRKFGYVWLDEQFSTCTELVPEGRTRIIMSDYRAG